MMNRILKRPMFRMGGRSDDGIMSVRPGYALGDMVKNMGTGGINLLKKAYNFIPEEGLLSKGARQFPATAAATKATGLMTSPFVLPAAIGVSNYPVYPKGHPKEGEFMPKNEAVKVLEESGQVGTAADDAGEAAMFDLETGEYPNKKYATKLDFDSPEVIQNSIDLGIINNDTSDDDTSDDDTSDDDVTNKGSKFDRKADLKTIYEDLLPMMEETLSDPDDKRRQLYTQLAQFGANLLAQPGGDLTGAIGKAAAKPLEGVGKVLQRDSDIDREAKILALKTAIDKTTPGQTGKLVQDLKNLNFSDDEILTYLKENRPGAATRANIAFEEVQALKTDLSEDFNIARNAGTAAKTMYDSIALGVPQTAYSELPKDKKDRLDGSYYVSPNGEVGRYNKEKGTLIKPGEKGFKDSKKNKS